MFALLSLCFNAEEKNFEEVYVMIPMFLGRRFFPSLQVCVLGDWGREPPHTSGIKKNHTVSSHISTLSYLSLSHAIGLFP